MKNKIILSLLLACALAMPIFAKAITVDELKAQIASLQAQITQLLAQLAQQQGGTTPWCHTFNTNLGMGSTGAEVNALHSVLSKEVITGDFGWASDKYDEETASFVVALQEKYASEILKPYGLQHGTGFVGKSTRAKLNKLYGCGTTACTADAKQCPDGSYVSRTGPNCEFAQCPTQATCTDSVDNGNNIYVKGETIGVPDTMDDSNQSSEKAKAVYLGGNSYKYTDYCVDSSIVKEFYCVGTKVISVPYQCPNGCSNGACLFAPVQKSISVVSPNGPNDAQKWTFGSPQTIFYNATGISNVSIYLWFPDGGMCKLADTQGNLGKYTVTLQENQQCPNIPKTITAGQYKISIWETNLDKDIATLHDASDDYFTITALKPDLIVKDFTYRNIPTTSSDPNAYFDITIQNIGQASALLSSDANNNFAVRVYKNSLEKSNIISGYIQVAPKYLYPNESYSYSDMAISINIPGSIVIKLDDIKSVIVNVDDTNFVKESNENNNTMTKEIK